MNNRPKRRKRNDNPYTIYQKSKDYIVEFKDIRGVLQTVIITEDVFNLFNSFELKEISHMNEFDRHIEHFNLTEQALNRRCLHKTELIDEQVILKGSFEELKNAINLLPENQKRRIKKYYFDDKNVYQIANEEKATHQAISKSLKEALKKLKEILQK